MRVSRGSVAVSMATLLFLTFIGGTLAARVSAQASIRPDDSVKQLVGRLDLEKYKATIKALTQFGDRLQGTDRNKAAVDWIEAQLKSYGCAPARLRYTYNPGPTAAAPSAPPPSPIVASGEIRTGPGGSRLRGMTGAHSGAGPSGTDLDAQPDPKLRTLNAQSVPPGPREEVYCTKVGIGHPGEMYIVGAHMDGRGLGEAADDNGSGTALVMELARIFSGADVQTDRSIRFALWNNEEGGLVGSTAYVQQRAPLAVSLALVIDALQPVRDADMARLREKCSVIDEAPERQQGVQTASLSVVAKDPRQFHHGVTLTRAGVCLPGS